jgi:2-polyprenyl-3-methyl-5-hydroxy-6-metoxy-1,4-benzoquinol methylase
MPETLQNCPLCDSVKLEKIYYNGKHGIVKCAECKLIFTNPRATPNEIGDLYGKNYMANLNSVKPLLYKICKKRLAFVENFKSRGRLLDVGCGNGYFLELARKNSWEIFGTEVSPYCISYCKKELELPVKTGEIFKANYADDHFDIITMWHTLEHVKNPMFYLKEFNRILKKGGFIFILVPNVRFLPNFIKGWSWIGRSEILEHLYFFSKETLESMIDKANLQIIHRSIGNIESIRSCFRQKVLNIFSIVGRIIYCLFKVNVAETIQVVAKKM